MIEASAPVRICDNGGWTDTWFGGPGRVLNVAVSPGVTVTIGPATTAGVVLDVVDFGDRYPVVPGQVRKARHALLEAAIDWLPPPAGASVRIEVRSAVPPGCSTGTSAAVAVALVGALAALRGEPIRPVDAAYGAHRLEVEVLGGESGIQDQMSVAFGGINFIEVDHYPQVRVERLGEWDQLDERLTLVYLGRAHDSAGVHRQVIAEPGPGRVRALDALRAAAVSGRRAVVDRDLRAFGRSLVANTEAQAALHPGLVGADARRVIAAAASVGAIGWKVNGAGGEGGSVTVLSPTAETRAAIEERIAGIDANYRLLPVRVSSAGLVVRRRA